jgi:Amt family ammonium transporter
MWMITEVIVDPDHKPKLVGMVSGAVAGLVSITPGAGFVDQNGAFWCGFFGGIGCYFGARVKHYLGYDDALDAFGVHAVGGMIGGICTGFFATSAVGLSGPQGTKDGVYFSNMTHGGKQLGLQFYGIGVSIGWSVFMSAILLLAVDYTLGLRVSMEDEDTGLDASIHGEENTPNPAKIDGLEMVTA